MKISNLSAIEILDSRGYPTIQCQIALDNKITVQASSPAGASKGAREAQELRDNNQARFEGKGVLGSIDAIQKLIAPRFIGQAPSRETLDRELLELDGNKGKKLGSNTMIAVSMAVARAEAAMRSIELYQLFMQEPKTLTPSMPKCMFNILNGGLHGGWNLSFQEYLIIPSTQTSVANTLAAAHAVYYQLKKILAYDGYETGLGDEGGFAPRLHAQGIQREYMALDYLVRARKEAGFESHEIGFGIDAAASFFYDPESNRYLLDNDSLSSTELVAAYEHMVNTYQLTSLEDGLSQDDHEGWKLLTEKLGEKIMLVGDDLFVTSAQLIEQGAHSGVANATIIKPNQQGTVTQALAAYECAKKYGYQTVISHRSGETNDSFIADLAVGLNAPYLKAGAPVRGERVSKYNRLLEIEKQQNIHLTF